MTRRCLVPVLAGILLLAAGSDGTPQSGWPVRNSDEQSKDLRGFLDLRISKAKSDAARKALWERPPMARLGCVGILVEPVSQEARSIGVANEILDSGLRESLSTEQPGLAVRDACSNLLYVNLNLRKAITLDETVAGYAAVLELQLLRVVEIEETHGLAYAPVWERSGMLWGDLISAKHDALRTLSRFTTQFIGDFREAGNAGAEGPS